MTSNQALEKSIYWQQQVVNQSRDPIQIARCKLAIAKLTAQLESQK